MQKFPGLGNYVGHGHFRKKKVKKKIGQLQKKGKSLMDEQKDSAIHSSLVGKLNNLEGWEGRGGGGGVW